MSDEIQQQPDQTEMPPVRPPLPSYREETGRWSSGELLRLIIAPTFVTVLLVGGVYWIRSQSPAGSAGQQPMSLVQVHLLPRPDSTPIDVAPASQSITDNAPSRTDASSREPSPTTSEEPAPAPKATAFAPAEIQPAKVKSAPSPVSGPPSNVVVKFQEALLRHVSRYHHYPNAARSLHLEGTVDTQFSMSRDGTLLGVWVKTSSGQAVLDREAVETIRRAQPLPRIPPELPDTLTVQFPIEFSPT